MIQTPSMHLQLPSTNTKTGGPLCRSGAPRAARVGSNLVGRRSNTACSRCRQKKKKCDQKLPKCRLCEVAGAECYGYDPLTKRLVSRSHVHDLEERVASLQAKLRRLEQSHIRPGVLQSSDDVELPVQIPTLSASSDAVADAASTAATIAALEATTMDTGAVFSKALLKTLRNRETIPSPSWRPPRPRRLTPAKVDEADACILSQGPVLLPPADAARGLFDAYFQFANLCMPLLHEKMFDHKVRLLYRLPRAIDLADTHTTREARLSVVFVFEVMAIGLLLKHKKEPLTSPLHLARQYHDLAAAALDKVGVPSTVEGVQALVLFAQYLYHHPTFEGAWSAVGDALRFAVDMALHQEPLPTLNADPLTIDTMRRTFWVAYMLDRNVSRSLSKPMFLHDGAISVKFPSVMRDEFITTDGVNTTEAHTSAHKHVALHLVRFRLIQSEMLSVLYERPPPPYKPIDLGLWQQEMRLRLDGWYNSVPCRRDAAGTEKTVIETFELTYQAGLMDLYRSTPNISTPTASQHLEAAEAAAQVITLYRYFFSEHKLTIYWQAVHCLYAAGEALLSGYVHTGTVRERLSFRDLQTLVQTCSSTLWGLTEHFPAGVGKRDAFNTMSTDILADLGKRSMVVDGREHVDLGNDQHVGDDSSSTVFTGHDGPLTDSDVSSNSMLDQQQASLLLSLSGIRPFNSQDIPALPASENETHIQEQEVFQASWDTDSMAHTYDPDPALVRYDNVDDLSVVWGGTDGFDYTFTPTWI